MSGPGGTGKSFLIEIVKKICFKTNKICQLTALTGCACIINKCQNNSFLVWYRNNKK